MRRVRVGFILAMISLILIPLTLILNFIGVPPHYLFTTSAIAIIPLAYFMGVATEELGKHSGPGVGGLLNATFGNATELIIALFAMASGPALFPIVKASITGSIIGNILLVLGLSMFFGGVRFKRQEFQREAASTMATMMTLATIALVMPSLTYYSLLFQRSTQGREILAPLSLWISAILLTTYFFGMLFSLHTHKHLFNPAAGHEEKPLWSLRFCILVLVASAALVSMESELLVKSIEGTIETWGFNELFVGVVLIATIGNAAEHGGAVVMAWKNKMDLSVGIASSSSAQIALFVAPILVLSSILTGSQMDLSFEIFELVAIALSVAVVTMVSSDGVSNWYEGLMLVMVYAILAIGFYFHP